MLHEGNKLECEDLLISYYEQTNKISILVQINNLRFSIKFKKIITSKKFYIIYDFS